jgi:hypothetical protein
MVLVIAAFIPDIHQQKDASSQSNPQSKDIDKGNGLIFEKAPNTDFKIILPHSPFCFVVLILKKLMLVTLLIPRNEIHFFCLFYLPAARSRFLFLVSRISLFTSRFTSVGLIPIRAVSKFNLTAYQLSIGVPFKNLAKWLLWQISVQFNA